MNYYIKIFESTDEYIEIAVNKRSGRESIESGVEVMLNAFGRTIEKYSLFNGGSKVSDFREATTAIVWHKKI